MQKGDPISSPPLYFLGWQEVHIHLQIETFLEGGSIRFFYFCFWVSEQIYLGKKGKTRYLLLSRLKTRYV